MNFKKLFFIFSVAAIILVALYFKLSLNNRFDEPVGGWEEFKVKIEEKYSANEDIKKAALGLGIALQEAIDNPQQAQKIDPKFMNAFSCFRAVLVSKGLTWEQSISESNFMKELATNTYERQRRYIAYNAALSGGVYPLVEDDVKNCDFVLSEVSK